MRGPETAMSSGTFGCAAPVEEPQPTRSTTAVDGVVVEVRLEIVHDGCELGDRHGRAAQVEERGVAPADAEDEASS